MKSVKQSGCDGSTLPSQQQLPQRKLKLVRSPEYYYARLDEYEETLKELPVDYVLLEGAFVRGLPDQDYRRILGALPTETREVEIWSDRVPLSTLCQSANNLKELGKLGIGFLRVQDWQDPQGCEGLREHPSLKTVYASHFEFVRQQQQPNAQDGETADATNNDDDAGMNANADAAAITNDNAAATNDGPGSELDGFVQALASCPQLEQLEFRKVARCDHVPWTPTSLAQLAHCTSLKQLVLRLVNLTSSDLHAFAQALLDSYANNSDVTGQLEKLDLSENRLDDDGCEVLFQALTRHPHLKMLYLRDNRLSQRACNELASGMEAAGETCVMEKLSLNKNPLGDGSAAALCRILSCNKLRNREIHRAGLTDRGCSQLAVCLANNTSCVSLSLNGNDMSDSSYVAFAEALETNTTLEMIDLQVDRRTAVGRRGAQALVDVVRNHNFVLQSIRTQLSASFAGERQRYSSNLTSYLRLNHAGRRHLLQGAASHEDWIQAVVKLRDDLEALNYLLRSNPLLCAFGCRGGDFSSSAGNQPIAVGWQSVDMLADIDASSEIVVLGRPRSTRFWRYLQNKKRENMGQSQGS